MPLRVNLNSSALFAQTNLGIMQKKLTTALEHLSSGLRINHSNEDPAGFLLQLQMQFQITGVNAGTNNLKMAIDLLNTADSFTRTIADDITRMNDLAFQAKNGLLTTAQRSSLQSEFNELIDEIERLATNATYNGQVLLDGTLSAVTVQTGYSQGDVVSLSINCLTIGANGMGIASLTIGSMTGAQSAISMLATAVSGVLNPRIASIGAQAAGWARSADAQEMYSANLQSARSRVIDADLAVETTNLTNAQVIVQSGIAALAQANAAQSMALGLIGG